MRGSYAAEEAPVSAVGGEPNGAGEHEGFGRVFEWAVGEMGGGQNFLSSGGIGRDDDGGGAEAESQELRVMKRERSDGGEGAMG